MNIEVGVQFGAYHVILWLHAQNAQPPSRL